MTHLTIHLKRLTAVGAVVIVAAMSATAAVAGTRPDDRDAVRAPGATAVYVPDAVDRYLAARAPALAAVRPDNRAGSRGEFRATVISGATASPSIDFQWDDAGIGAALLAGLLLAGGSGLVLVRRSGGKSSPARGV
jgi:hypothetical protein